VNVLVHINECFVDILSKDTSKVIKATFSQFISTTITLHVFVHYACAQDTRSQRSN